MRWSFGTGPGCLLPFIHALISLHTPRLLSAVEMELIRGYMCFSLSLSVTHTLSFFLSSIYPQRTVTRTWIRARAYAQIHAKVVMQVVIFFK